MVHLTSDYRNCCVPLDSNGRHWSSYKLRQSQFPGSGRTPHKFIWTVPVRRSPALSNPCGGVDWPKCFQLSSEMMGGVCGTGWPLLWPLLDDTMSLSPACGCSWGQARLTLPCNKKSNASPPLPASGILLTLFTSLLSLSLSIIYAILLFRPCLKPLFPPSIISTAAYSQLYNHNGENYR